MTLTPVTSRLFRHWKRSAICGALLAFSLISTPAHAADPASGTSTAPEAGPRYTALTLADCIAIALDNNHARSASRYSMEIAEAQHQQALSGHWPQVGLKAAYTVMDGEPNFIFPARTFSSSVMGMPVNVDVPEQNVKLMDRKNFVATLNATLPLYTGGQVSALVRQAEQGMRAAREEARRTDLQIIYDTTRYYQGALLARQLLQVGRDTLSRMEVTLELTENLYTKGSGRVKKTDYLRNKTVVEAIRSTVTALEANENLAKAALTNSMGVPWDTPIGLADGELPFNAVPIAVNDLVGGTYRFNPDWARMEAGLEAAAAKIDEAHSGHLPKIALTGSLNRIVNSYDQGIVTRSNRESWTVGIGMELPLFNGLRTSAEVREARARLARLKEQQVLLKEGLALQVKHLALQLQRAQDQKTATEAAAAAAEENRSLNERAYQEELVETKDVIEAQLMESLMKAQHLKTLYDHLEAKANLNFVVGKEVEQLMNTGE